MLVDVATHLVAAERHGPYRKGEMTLSREILPDIAPGMLVIMDRNFHAYDFLWSIKMRGAQFLVRVKPKKLKSRAVVHLGPGDDIVSVRYTKKGSSLESAQP